MYMRGVHRVMGGGGRGSAGVPRHLQLGWHPLSTLSHPKSEKKLIYQVSKSNTKSKQRPQYKAKQDERINYPKQKHKQGSKPNTKQK